MVAIALFSGLLSGCAVNPYAKYYINKIGGPEHIAKAGVKVFSEAPVLLRGSLKPEKDAEAMMEEGFDMLGYSTFNGPEFPEEKAVEQAKNIGATRVVIYSKYTETQTGAVPLFSTIGNAVIATTTIPTHQRRYDQGATYWAPGSPGLLGIRGRPLNDEERARLQTNKGVAVAIVIKKTPAYQTDLLKGDIIRAVNGKAILSADELSAVLNEFAGQQVTIALVRGSEALTKVVTLNKKP